MSLNEKENLVEEFPRPPRYYECFDVENSLLEALGLEKPPQIPNDIAGNVLYSRIYDASFDRSRFPSVAATSASNEEVLNIPHADYKREMKSAIRKVLLSSLPLMSPSTTNPSDIQFHSSTVRSSISDFYKILAVYRNHEGKVEIYNHFQVQLEKAKEIEKELISNKIDYEKILQDIES